MGTPEERVGYFRSRWQRIKNQWIQDVPEEIAACEFACRKPKCQQDHWEICEKRLRNTNQNQVELNRFQDEIEEAFQNHSDRAQGRPDGNQTRRLETVFSDEQKQPLNALLLQEMVQSLSRWLQRTDLSADVRNEMQELHEKVRDK